VESQQREKKRGNTLDVGRFEGGRLGRGVPPHYIHEFENKGVAKWVPRKCMKKEG
jgi:hypothetical protein